MSTTDVTPSRKRFSLYLPPKAWNFGLLAATVSMDMSLGLSQLATNLLAVAFGASAFHLGLKGVIWCIPYVVFCPLSGRLSDRAGRKRIALAAAVFLMFLYLSLSRITTLTQLLIITPLCGLATGVFWPPIQSWVGDLRTVSSDPPWAVQHRLEFGIHDRHSARLLVRDRSANAALIAALLMAFITMLVSGPESQTVRSRSETNVKTAQPKANGLHPRHITPSSMRPEWPTWWRFSESAPSLPSSQNWVPI